MHPNSSSVLSSIKLSIFFLFMVFTTNVVAFDPSQIYFTEEETNWIKENNKIRVRVSDWPPYMMTKPTLSGQSVDYLKLIAEHHGLNIELVTNKIEWSESVKDVATDREVYDLLLTMTPSLERKKLFAFTDIYLDMPLVIFMQEGGNFISSVIDLKGKKLAIEKGFLLNEKLAGDYPEIILVEADNTLEALQLVSNGQADAYIGNLANSIFFIRENGLSNLKVAAPTSFDNQKLAMAVRKDWPELASIISKSFNAITQEEKNEIQNKWASIRYEYGVNSWDIFLWVISISSVLLIIVIVVIRVNNILNKEIKSRKEIATELEKYIQVVNENVMIISVDKSGKIISASNAFCNNMGFQKDDLLGKPLSLTLHPDVHSMIFEQIYNQVLTEGNWEGEIKKLTKSGSEMWAHVLVSPITKDSEIQGLTFINQDITDKKIVEKLSITDQLTGLFNRRKIEKVLPDEIERCHRYDHQLSIALVDIDFFKKVNDIYGHQAGDKVLMLFAKILNSNTRRVDIVGRWGGEEFLIVCPGTSREGILVLTEYIRQCVEEYDFVNPNNITISFGVTTFQEDDSVVSIIKRADDALYKAKETGRNKVVFI